MGDLIELYTPDEMKRVSGRFIYNMVRDRISFDTIDRLANDPPTVTVELGTVDKMLEFKRVLEYKWFLPIHYRWKYKQLIFRGYSAYLLLKLIEPHQLFHSKKRKDFEWILEQTTDCTVPVYAAGAIEKAPDKGIGYRRDLKAAMEFTKVSIVDPCDFAYNLFQGKQKTLQEVDAVCSLRDSYIKTRTVVEGDCAAVVETEAVMALIDQYLGSGTTSELTVAVAFKRPVYAVLGEGMELKDVTPWVRCCPSRYFGSIQALANFVKESEIK